MEIPETRQPDVLALAIRARLFGALRELRRPATTQELAAAVKRHPNSARVQLVRLAEAGLLERRTVRQARGRPRHLWAIARTALPAGEPPDAHAQLGRWLARAIPAGEAGLADIERGGREIGRELAPGPTGGPVADAMRAALAALGFAPQEARAAPGRLSFELGNCPYRDAVRENQPVVCTLHRGITQGLLDRLSSDARLTRFIPKDPYAAGCVIEFST